MGGTVEIPTLDGKVKIKIDEGTPSGKVLRLKGKGLPDLNGYGRGDLLVCVNVWIPKKLNKKKQELLEQLSGKPNMQPNPNQQEKRFFDKMKDLFN